MRRPFLGDSPGNGLCCTLHQVDRLDGFVLYSISVQFVNLGTREYLHTDGKFTK